MVLCRVLLLDGSDYEVQVDEKVIGQEVFDKVCEHLSLLEKDYFGFTYRDKDYKFWLRLDKKISKQISGNWVLTFGVKFYPPNPVILKEELTRYLLFLQLRTDINAGRLPCSFLTQALLGSYAAQSQIGDYDEDEHGEGVAYLKGMLFGPNQSDELLEKIVELHKTHRGDSPAVTEMAYLENAKNVAMYGVHMHLVKVDGEEVGVTVNVGVCAIGLLIYKDRLRTNRFCWAKIIKISFKRDKFYIKLRPEENERKGEKLTYKLPDVSRAKALWRLAMEHHTFFRMREAAEAHRNAFSRAGGYAFCGRTMYQAQMASDQIQRSGHDFIRGTSTRFVSSKSLNALMTGGFSTEREEQHIAEAVHPAATLNIKKSLGSQSSLQFADYDTHGDQFGQNGYEMIAGRLVDRYGRPVDLDPNANLNAGYQIGIDHNAMQGHYFDSNYQTTDIDYAQGGQGGYPNGFGGATYGPDMYGSRTATLSSRAESPNPPMAKLQPLQPTRDKYGNVVIVKNQNRLINGSFASSDDRIVEHNYDRDGQEDGSWHSNDAYGVGKTTTTTYSTPNGTIVTEYRTVRNGVVETRVEKRKRQMTEYEEEIDYDALLARAIGEVADMDPNLAVEKIVIHTKTEETMA